MRAAVQFSVHTGETPVALVCNGEPHVVTGIDASACFSLQRLDAACRGGGVRLILCNVSPSQHDRLTRLHGGAAG